MKLLKVVSMMMAVVFAATFFSNCKKSSPEDAAKGFLKGFVKVMEDNQTDPDKAGDAISKYIADNESLLAEMKKLKGDPKKLENDKELQELMKKMMGVMMKMAMDPKFQKSEKFKKALKDMEKLK